VLNRVFSRSLDPTEVLSKALHDHPLPPLDRGLATELVYGACRQRYAIESLLPKYLKLPINKMEQTLVNLLRLGVYQLLYLDQVPAHAAIYETVELGKQLDEGAGRFVNAILRSVLRDRDADGAALRPPPERALPGWLWHRWVRRLGEEQARAAAKAMVTIPPLHLRVNPLRTNRDTVLAALNEKGILVEASPIAPEGIILQERHPVETLPGFREGWWYVQDIGAMMVSRVLDPQPGERVLDLCAAPGGKTTHIAELMEDRGYLVAVDRDAARIRKVKENCERLGITMVEMRVANVATSQVNLALADRVLADVPCSGFGVIRRQPDVLWRKDRAELARLPAEQLAILKQAASLVKKGGVLVYSTCTTEPEENEAVVTRFLAETNGFTVDSILPYLPQEWHSHVNEAGTILLWPQWSGTDGFFIARLVRHG